MLQQRPSGLIVDTKLEPPPKLECHTNMIRRRDLEHVMRSLLASRAVFVSLVDTRLENKHDSLAGAPRYALTYLHDKRFEFEEYC